MSVIRGTTITTPLARHAVPDDTAVSKKPWSSKHTVDMLCPSIMESGGVVTCEPLVDYPMEAVSTINEKADGSEWNSITLTQCGKNLFDFKKGTGEIHFTASDGVDTLKYGYAIPLPAGTYTIHATPVSADNKDRYIYLYLNDASGKYLKLLDYQIDGSDKTHLRQGKANSCVTRKYTFDRNVVLFVYQGGVVNSGEAQAILVDEHNIQIEAGSVKTAYEPYRGQTFTTDLSEYAVSAGNYNWTTGVLHSAEGSRDQLTPIAITALDGTNVLYSDCGNTEVKGKADPVAIINKLTNAILALGGNV